MADVIHDAIIEGMARAIWVFAYMQSQFRAYEYTAEIPFDQWDDGGWPQRDWETAHSTPPSAISFADVLARWVERENVRWYGPTTSIVTLYEAARIADVGSDDLDVEDARSFGYYVSAMCLGESKPEEFWNEWRRGDLGEGTYLYLVASNSVSWFDDHKEFDLSLPSMIAAFIGGDLIVKIYGTEGHTEQRQRTSEWGADPRVMLYSSDEEEAMLIEDFKKKSDVEMFHAVIDAAVDFGVSVSNEATFLMPASHGDGFVTTRRDAANRRVAGDQRIVPESLKPLVAAAVNAALRDTFDRGRVGDGRSYDVTWGKLNYANFNDHNFYDEMFVLWFGDGYHSNYVVVFARSLEDAFEEGMDYVSETWPGLLANEVVREEFERLHKEFYDKHGRDPVDEEMWKLMEEAEEDTSSDGQGNHIQSDHWGISLENPSLKELVDFEAHISR